MLGIDLVHIPSFAEQLAMPGTDFLTRVFSVPERLEASRRSLSGAAATRFFAGRWAAKEAFVKAWSQALFGQPPVISPDRMDWREISVVADAWGRVSIQLSGAVANAFAEKTPGDLDGPNGVGAEKTITAVSISHDGDYATAIVQLGA